MHYNATLLSITHPPLVYFGLADYLPTFEDYELHCSCNITALAWLEHLLRAFEKKKRRISSCSSKLHLRFWPSTKEVLLVLLAIDGAFD